MSDRIYDNPRSHAERQKLQAEAANLKTVEERVEYIADLMGDLKWRRGKTSKALCEIWGVAKSTVENYSAEASRLVTSDEATAKRDITAGARKLFVAAVEVGDAKGAKAMGDLWAAISGAKAPDKHEHKVSSVTLDDLDEMRATAEANACDPSNETEPSS
jgi:hypothetical protein